MIESHIIDLVEDFGMTDITCDCCGDSVTVNCVQYRSVNEEIKEQGWLVKYIDGEYCHFCCEECYQAYKDEREDWQ